MSQQSLNHHLAAEVHRILVIEGPAVRARRAVKADESLRATRRKLKAIRREALREMRDVFGMTTAQIAKELDVSWTRAKQLLG